MNNRPPFLRKRLAVIGSGISGLSAAWLLARDHDVTIYDRAEYAGGHTNTVDAETPDGIVPVDTGFIVYNERNYPNLCALFRHLEVRTAASDMSFSVSANGGRFEYAGSRPSMLFAQKRNIANPHFLIMLRDLLRFYALGRRALAEGLGDETLGDFLKRHRIGQRLIDYHVLPLSAAIWSSPTASILNFPAEPFFRFMANHGLLGLGDRPLWRTVVNGGRSYVEALLEDYEGALRLNTGVEAVTRTPDGVRIEDRQGGVEYFDQVVMASHADESLRMIKDPDEAERRVLGAFRYQRNLAVLHTDRRLMPSRRRAWAAWNYMIAENRAERAPLVTYWMNRLQPLKTATNLFVTLNPPADDMPDGVLRSFPYDHPMFDMQTDAMQRMIWDLQGRRGLWFCGSYLGHGFHEDGIQSGLAVAEALGGGRRPWAVEAESGRLQLPEDWPPVTVRRAGRAA
ncbi:MAG: NAD(P)/FAD-dependent oxidoreductase [Minwuia sp.]|uniref:NAD(P)/FAD-dependent oxidoreductase n=1 Tax=Minwuia sp. TaxID=2493630 RepID=UPI003A843F5D